MTPIDAARNLVRARRRWSAQGWARTVRAEIGDLLMRRAAPRLRNAAYPARPEDPPVVFMTGRRFWYQSLFAAYSFTRAAGRAVRVRFVDDGTLTPDLIARLRRVFPAARIDAPEQVAARLAAACPPARHPVLWEMRAQLVLMRKILDVFAGEPEYTVFSDSDILYFAPPTEVFAFAHARAPFYMVDVTDDPYLAPRPALAAVRPGPCLPAVNTGLIGLTPAALDWARLEHYAAGLRTVPGNRHLFEQTLLALAFSDMAARPLPKDKFVVKLDREPVACTDRAAPACIHYVWRSKLDFFGRDWARCLRRPAPGPS